MYTSPIRLNGVSRTIESNNNVGISGIVGGAFGPAKVAVLGGYDTDQENGAVRAILTADLGPGTLGLAAIWASGQNASGDFTGSDDAWKAGLTFDYQLATNLSTKASVQYYDADNAISTENEAWSGFLLSQCA